MSTFRFCQRSLATKTNRLINNPTTTTLYRNPNIYQLLSFRRFGGHHGFPHDGHQDYPKDHPPPGWTQREWDYWAMFMGPGSYIWGTIGACWLLHRFYVMRHTMFGRGVLLWFEPYWP